MTILAVGSSQAMWYLTRGSGLVALILLTVSMALGIAQYERWAGPTGQRFVVTHIHRNASLLAVVFLGVHIATSIIDAFAPITWLDAVIPFRSPYRPLWLGFGALAFDLVLALVITSLVRSRISYGAWKAVHWAAYLCWPLAFVHGLGTGTDGRVGWVQVVDLACLGIMVLALAWRLTAGLGAQSDRSGHRRLDRRPRAARRRRLGLHGAHAGGLGPQGRHPGLAARRVRHRCCGRRHRQRERHLRPTVHRDHQRHRHPVRNGRGRDDRARRSP